MAETPDRPGSEQPEAQPAGESRLPVGPMLLAALAVIGAATANSLPNLNGFSSLTTWPDFSSITLPHVDRIALPDFSRFMPHKQVAEVPPKPVIPVLVPDPVVRAGLRDIQSSQEEQTATLASLTQNATAQQADLRRITRQLAVLSAQVSSLQNPIAAAPVAVPETTSSILSFPGSTPPPHRSRVRTSRRVVVPPLPPLPPVPPPPAVSVLPPPAGPVSVGGAPLSPTPAARADAG